MTVLNGSRGAAAVGDYPQDPADAGANLSESERSEAVLAVAREQRSAVLAALQRIDLGTYGTCVECGGPVPEGRLEAKPEAARCVACQGNLIACLPLNSQTASRPAGRRNDGGARRVSHRTCP